MNVLIAVASRHGSTREIGEAIADELHRMDIDAEVRDAGAFGELPSADAVVIGSAVYMGHWMDDAKLFVDDRHEWLAARPVWLFGSGPVGSDDAAPASDPKELERLMARTRAREHRTFAGRMDPADLGRGERFVTKLVHAPTGDFRDWDAIRAWARSIGETLRSEASLGRVPAAAAAIYSSLSTG